MAAGGVRERLPDYLGRLYGYALSLTAAEDAARDLVQEASARALAARRVPTDEAAFRAWLFTIIRNLAIDGARSRKHESGAPAPEGEVWGFDDRRIEVLTVRQAMRRLSDEAREVIALVDVAGFTYREASQVLGVPIGTVMSRLSRARKALLSAIESSTVTPIRSRHAR